MSNNLRNLIKIKFLLVTIFLGFAFFVWTFIPYAQMAVFFVELSSIKINPSIISGDNNFDFYPITYLQPQLRMTAADFFVSNNQIFNADVVSVVAPIFASRLEETINMPENTVYSYVAAGKIFDYLGDQHTANSTEYYLKAEDYYKKALSVYPRYQKVMFAYAVNLTNQNKFDEALQMVQTAYNEDPRVPEAHYYLGLIQFLSDNIKNSDEALDNLEFGLTYGQDQMVGATKLVYEKMLINYYSKGDIARFKTVVTRLESLNPLELSTYQKIIDYINQTGTIPLINLKY